MKIRTGFVSNSSSSSFVILGTKISAEEQERIEDTYIEECKKENPWFYSDEDGNDWSVLWDFIDAKFLGKYKLNYVPFRRIGNTESSMIGIQIDTSSEDSSSFEVSASRIIKNVEICCEDFGIKPNLILVTGPSDW